MKKYLLLLFMLGFATCTFAQLNFASQEELENQVEQGNLQILGKSDFNVDDYFTPTDKINFDKIDFRLDPGQNAIGVKIYLQKINGDLYPVIDHNNKTYTMDTIPTGYYKITRIIRFKEQMNSLMKEMGCDYDYKDFEKIDDSLAYITKKLLDNIFYQDYWQREFTDTENTNSTKKMASKQLNVLYSKEELLLQRLYEHLQILDDNKINRSSYTCIPNDNYFYGVNYFFDKWFMEIYNSLPSISKFEERVLLEKGRADNFCSRIIYEFTNDSSGKSYYIINGKSSSEVEVFDIPYYTRYRITPIYKRKEIIKIDTIRTLTVGSPAKSGGITFKNPDINIISVPFYEKLCADLKGKDVLILFEEETFQDAISKNILKAPVLESPDGVYRTYREEIFKKTIVYESSNYYWWEYKWPEYSFPEITCWSKCIDVIIKDGRLYGLFMYDGAKFYLEIGSRGKIDVCYSNLRTDKDECIPAEFYKYDRSDYFAIASRQEIESVRQRFSEAYNRVKTEAEREDQQEQQEMEKRMANEKQQRRADLIANYGEEFGNMIADKKIVLGMTKDMCYEAWGNPQDKYNTTTSLGNTSVWVYNYKTSLYFYDGVLKQIDH